jgi:hypothetical protein
MKLRPEQPRPVLAPFPLALLLWRWLPGLSLAAG